MTSPRSTTCGRCSSPNRPRSRPARGTPEVAELLAKICDRMGELHDAPASEQLAADTVFHYTIAEASGSPRLHALVRQVSAIPEAYRSGIPYTSGDMIEAERQHRAIAVAIRRRSEANARRADAIARRLGRQAGG